MFNRFSATAPHTKKLLSITATCIAVCIVLVFVVHASSGKEHIDRDLGPTYHEHTAIVWQPPASAFASYELRHLRKLRISNHASSPKDQLPRNIYIDAGAKDGRTLTLFQKAAHSPLVEVPWDVFAFEPSPVFFALNEYETNRLSKRNIPQRTAKFATVPPQCQRRPELFEVEGECQRALAETVKFQEEVFADYAEKGLPIALVEERLKRRPDTSLIFAPGSFVHVPAAVSTEDGVVHLSWSTDNAWNGGGTTVGINSHTMETRQYEVVAVDFASWLASVAVPSDYVFLKLDIGGAEFAVLEQLMKTGAIHLIDEISIAFHSRYDSSHAVESLIPGILYMLHTVGIVVHYH
jgi:hypothetical protein